MPTRAEQQEILLAVLAEVALGECAVVDLGVGSGLVAEAALEALPHVSLIGVDSSEAMLELARARLGRFGERVSLLRHDLAEVAGLVLPPGRYAAVFTVQTLHHLTDVGKEAAIAWSARVVEPGGLVMIVDRVSVPEPLFREWAAVWRRVDPATPGTYAEYQDELRRGGDRPASLQDQLGWLARSGLDAVCLHSYGNRAVLVGRKPDR